MTTTIAFVTLFQAPFLIDLLFRPVYKHFSLPAYVRYVRHPVSFMKVAEEGK